MRASKSLYSSQMTQVVGLLSPGLGIIIVVDIRVDVTEIIGSGKVDMGFKAMIHTLAVSSFSRCMQNLQLIQARRKPVTSRSHPLDLSSMSHSRAYCI
jgi:hypothetical protein